MVVYPKIFKQAYEITRNNKFLWILGLFLTFTTTVFWEENKEMSFSAPMIWLILVLIVVFLVIYFRCKASMIIGIKAIVDKQETSLSKIFKTSRFFYSRILVIYILTELAVLIVGSLIAIPIAYMFDQGKDVVAIGFLTIGLLIFIPIAVTAALIAILSPMFVVIYDLKPGEAARRSMELISQYWIQLTLIALLMCLPQILILLISVPIVFLADLPYHMVGFISMIAGLLILWLIHSIIAVFTQSVWVLVFLEIVKPQKIEDEEQVVVPEIAG